MVAIMNFNLRIKNLSCGKIGPITVNWLKISVLKRLFTLLDYMKVKSYTGQSLLMINRKHTGWCIVKNKLRFEVDDFIN